MRVKFLTQRCKVAEVQRFAGSLLHLCAFALRIAFSSFCGTVQFFVILPATVRLYTTPAMPEKIFSAINPRTRPMAVTKHRSKYR
jgi:hypothetical protein